MKLNLFIIVLLNAALLIRSDPEELSQDYSSYHRTVREVFAKPNKTCNSSQEGHTDYNIANPRRVWICKNSEWIPFKLVSTLGTTKHLSGQSCKEIQIHSSSNCEIAPKSEVYWVKGMQVYCEMNSGLDKGGWMLVWQHSYMEDLPLTTNMTFFSKYYKPCTQHATSWCNVPNKARFNPTEQMIVAYLNKQIIYAYKGDFNMNIDYNWSGGILIAHRSIIDKCSYFRGVRPQPVKSSLPVIAFSKYSSSCNYYGTGGTITGTLTSPKNDRWRYCRNSRYVTNDQMTLAIYIR